MKYVSDELLRKYARLAVVSGANIQKGQPLLIRSNVGCAEFCEMCVQEAYKAGCSYVKVQWSSEEVTRQYYLNVSDEVLEEVPDYSVEEMHYIVDKHFALLSISCSTPGYMADVDPKKMMKAQMASAEKTAFFRNYTMASQGQWSIVAIPNEGWAKKVFPNDNTDTAMKKLWDAVLLTVRVREDNDPVEEWKQHTETLQNHCKLLNGYNFKELYFKNSLGTNLHVGLAKNHLWGGGDEPTPEGIRFNPNMPTEEVFTTPDKYDVNGVVYATMPLNANGKLIENFHITFEKGKAVAFGAEKEEEALKTIIETDANSCYLGEVALVPFDSPINQTGILFYNTLFDENASCHLALGSSYPMQIKDGEKKTDEEMDAAHANTSHTHCDFMFGSKDMHCVGITYDGKEIDVLVNGSFVI